MNDPAIRRAQLADLDAIMALEAEFSYDQMSRRSWRRMLQSPSAVVLVAIHDGRLVGNQLLLTRKGSRTGRIYSIAVASTARRQGWAERMNTQLEALAQQRGLHSLVLESHVGSVAATRLYQKLGYQMLEQVPGYYSDGGDAQRWRKTLDLPAVI